MEPWIYGCSYNSSSSMLLPQKIPINIILENILTILYSVESDYQD